MELVRRIVILAVAVSYGLSFVAVCLAACLMGPSVEHGCCRTESEQAVRAADSDCCSVTAGISHGTSFAAQAAPALWTIAPVVIDARMPAAPSTSFLSATPSPPLVLRI